MVEAELQDLLFQLRAWTLTNQLRKRENDAENALAAKGKTIVVNVRHVEMIKVIKSANNDGANVSPRKSPNPEELEEDR